ncbi:MAG: hypothetical protein ACTSVV_06115 [Promethearchaeota archaeon]
MTIEKDGEKILQEHNILFKKLLKIPESRELIYREESINGQLIGKPRFKEKKYQWNPDLLEKLRSHLQKIWNFFEKYSYWFDDSIRDMINYDYRRLSKKSIVFLLENDVWETDEVYGDYLIEETEGNTQISYFRFEKKFQEFPLQKLTKETREKWIKKDVINQIKNQFEYLWKKLENEILTCMEEEFHKASTFQLTNKYFDSEMDKIRKVIKISKEASLLSLGRLQELWLLKALNLESSNLHMDITVKAELESIISKGESRLLRKIRHHYNRLKHSTTYNIDGCNIEDLLDSFVIFLKRH